MAERGGAESGGDVRLRRMIEGIELIDSEIADLQGERRDRMAEIKAVGYDLATVRKVILRRKLSPAERGEADALLEAYEAALGGEAAAVPRRASALDLAAALLAEQLEGLSDPDQAARLVEHVLSLLDIRGEIAVLRGQEKDRRALAKGEGFEVPQLALVVRWYEKCAKWGPAAMKAGEHVFRAYRASVDEAGGESGRFGRPDGLPPPADEKLAALFGKPAPKAPTAKQRSISDAVAMARINRGAGGGR